MIDCNVLSRPNCPKLANFLPHRRFCRIPAEIIHQILKFLWLHMTDISIRRAAAVLEVNYMARKTFIKGLLAIAGVQSDTSFLLIIFGTSSYVT